MNFIILRSLQIFTLFFVQIVSSTTGLTGVLAVPPVVLASSAEHAQSYKSRCLRPSAHRVRLSQRRGLAMRDPVVCNWLECGLANHIYGVG